MTPAARVQAAIEMLELVIEAAREGGAAADVIVQRYFRSRRYAGSKDRRAVRDLVFDTIRAIGERPESGRAAILGAKPELEEWFGTGGHAPEPIAPAEGRAETSLAPNWLLAKLGKRADPALLSRAGIDLRVNTLRAERPQMLHLGQPIADLPNGIAGAPEDIAARPEYEDGRVEIQDAGSQRIVQMCGAAPGMTVVDLCAGAGGKTLALAADMAAEGRLIAADTDRMRLGALRPRAERAGATMIESRLLDPQREMEALTDLAGAADVVLVDAPCSGTGTWRRNPEARWRLTPERLQRLTRIQAQLITLGASLVRPGGSLVYAVCSLLPDEGDHIVSGFGDPQMRLTDTRLLTPQKDGSDGFFIARFERAC